MKVFIVFLVFLLSLDLIGQEASFSAEGRITVKVSNIRSDTGQIYLFLYNYENQYPETPYNFYKVSKSVIQEGRVEFEIPEKLKFGKYALTLIDDENFNDNLDKKFGIPVEGFGFSNDEKPLFFILPKYEELLFDLNKSSIILGVEVQYLL